jgi:hypothetical protein
LKVPPDLERPLIPFQGHRHERARIEEDLQRS